MLSFKNLWFQLHWFIGVTAGTVLIVTGLSGAVYAFQEEILDAINPGTAWVPVRSQPVLDLPQAVAALRAQGEARAIQRITVSAEPGRAVQVALAAEPGERRGPPVFLDPYTGARLAPRIGTEFFDWALRLHRWLLLPRDDGKPITGTLAGGLLVLSLSGLYLRWPRRPLSLRTWFTFDTRLRGRSFLWGLHSVIGTWALVAYVVFSATGLYWAFDAVRGPVDRLAGVPARGAAAPAAPRPQPPQPSQPSPEGTAPDGITPVWTAFAARAACWQWVQLRLPDRPGAAVQVLWLDADAPHDRARNRMNVQPDGTVRQDERFADLPAGRRALGAIYPLHLGSYFGLPGRIFMALASLAMPLFAITGWMLYLDRRRKARAVRQERAALDTGTATGNAVGAHGAAGDTAVLVAFASQAGRAERLAVRTVAALRAAGLPATLAPVAQLDAEQLRHHRRVLFIASTFGEGDPPDAARRFARLLGAASGTALPHLHYGLLALGDRQYTAFCGFGHALDHQLRRLGAQPLFPLIEMDGEDASAWAAWQAALAGHLGVALADEPGGTGSTAQALPAVAFAGWTLSQRQHCNPGSQGAPLFALQLTPPEGTVPAWQPGALVEVLPRHAADTIDALLLRHRWAGDAPVQWNGQTTPLRDALACSALPTPGSLPVDAGDVGDAVDVGDAGDVGDAAAQAVADTLQPLAARSYSIASLPGDGHVALWVRQVRHDAGLGTASGWLTAHAPSGTPVALRLVENRAFAPAEGDAPAIFIGNGSGYAGLRAHLLARIRSGQRRNWLLFGERQRAHDAWCEAEATQWLAAGQIERADFVYSRDQPERRYVQDALRSAADPLRAWVQAEGAVVYVCGSLDGMAAGVDAALAEVLGADALEDLIAAGRYRRDVY
ncbi:MAG: nitric oxide synthase [Comamonadaceae bacterium]|nr:MAG: nitric oxide synthase [Comamonadaceae bacterium]